MLFIQPTVRRIREEDLKQGKASGLQAEPPDHSWSLLGSSRVSDGDKLSGQGCPE